SSILQISESWLERATILRVVKQTEYISNIDATTAADINPAKMINTGKASVRLKVASTKTPLSEVGASPVIRFI
ncbi:hypothetical protein, partial [Sphingomonas sp. 10B4]|uniref:hypothetical protein n=1 Tax=Sphingomonas sp. 10B4 TaxID=3048575 RepID=UPI002B224F82